MKNVHKINNNITFKFIKLIDLNSNYLGIFKLSDCLKKSYSSNMDLVELDTKKNFSICKIFNYKKFLYLINKNNKKKNKNLKINNSKKIKEIKFNLFIAKNDYDNKFKLIVKFLNKGLKVKLTLLIKGREILKKKIIKEITDKIILETSKFGSLINTPNYSKNTIFLYFNPKNVKK